MGALNKNKWTYGSQQVQDKGSSWFTSGEDYFWSAGFFLLIWHEFKHTPRDSEGQGSLACCIAQCLKESDMTEWLNNKLFTGFSLINLLISQKTPLLISPSLKRILF